LAISLPCSHVISASKIALACYRTQDDDSKKGDTSRQTAGFLRLPLSFKLFQMMRHRLDQLLIARGLFESREKAQRAIMAGQVRVGGHVVDKASASVLEDAEITVATPDRYVGRGGHKLEAALTHFGISPQGMTCLDIGASTGGFTDCLLQHGAAKVWAIDVGHSQLDWRIRSDPRVVVREKLNARYLTREDVPDALGLIVADVSFISLALILPPARELLVPGGAMVVLIKPQFELRREEVGRGGVVKDPALHEAAVERIRTFVEKLPPAANGERLNWVGSIESPILGGEGNKEFLACLRSGA
jgi:23S rRNA (cytidine1920-2'-O)/16S rRNA (cytidine1409-2'-O)-methyltransferase